MLGTVNEKKSITLACTFYDETGAVVTPDQATYQLDDIKATGDTSITAETAFTPSALNISSEENRILDATKANERRLVTIRWTYAGGAKTGNHQEEYLVKNLSKVT